MLVSPDVPMGDKSPAFALANFIKTTLHAFTATLAVENERLVHDVPVNQINLTRRVRSEEPRDLDEHLEEVKRFARAVLLVGAPLPDAEDSPLPRADLPWHVDDGVSDYLPFEKAIDELGRSAAALRAPGGREAEAAQLETRARRQLADLYGRLTPWQRTMVARHPARPQLPRLVNGLFEDFMPLAGDRAFGDDKAIIGGLARFQRPPRSW